MRPMPSTTWSEANRRPLAFPAVGADQIAGLDVGHEDEKWSGRVRVAVFAAGIVGSWGGVWLTAHEILRVIHGGT